MSDMLAPYLPRIVRYWNSDAPGQIHRSIDGSMVLVDISGFTQMSERLARHGKVGAEEVTEVIDSTLGRLLPAAYAYGANLVKFGGDSMLLLFTSDGHAQRACTAALAMRRELQSIGTFVTTAGQVHLRMSVGVHSGMFDFFLVGGSHHELIVAGPCATWTVEMEAAAAAGQILLSPATASALPRRNHGKAVADGTLLRGEVAADRFEFPIETSPEIDLGPFVPKVLRQFLLAGGVEPEHRLVTVAFVHFWGFDDLIEREGSASAARSLDQVVRAVQEACDRHEVTFLGTDIAADGGKFILTAGVPVATGNEEEQMLSTVRQLASTDLPLPLSIGVNWGPVFAGEVGPPDRRTYTVLGDTVNLAARLMAKASTGQVVTAHEVLEGSRTIFETTNLPPFHVKGKKAPVTASLLGGPVGTRANESPIPLVGRESELGHLVTAFEEAKQLPGRLVMVAAEPGMGKSRLLQEFLQQIDPGQIFRVECQLYQSATPYFPFRALLRQALGIEGHDIREMDSQLRKLVATHAPELSPWLSLLAAPLNLEIEESPEAAELDDQYRPARTIETVRALLEKVVHQPVVFVIGDIHWMDVASCELLTGLISSLEHMPWLLVVTTRPIEAAFTLPDRPWATRISLERLDQAQTEALIGSATKASPLRPQQVKTLAARADGNPLFVIELLQALRDGADVESLPQSVEGLIGARIDKLPPIDRNVLRRMAVLGNRFQIDHTAAVLPDTSNAERIRAIRRIGDLMTINQGGWVQFRHALIRDAAYGGLPFRTRQRLHAQVGDYICAASGDKGESQAELLSLHYFRAQHWDAAWRFSRVAGDGAKEVYANAEAATLYTRALDASRRINVGSSERAEVFKGLAQVQYEAGFFDAAKSALRNAIKLVSDDLLSGADLHLQLARVFQKLGAFTPALRETAIGLRLVEGVESSEAMKARARLRAFRAGILSDQFRPREALRVGLPAVEEAQASGELESLARVYSYIDEAYQTLGQRDMAIHEPMALEIFETLGNLPGIALLTNNLGVQAYSDGRWDEAISFYSRGQDASRRSGNEAMEGVAATNLGEVLISRGRLAEAEEVLTEAKGVLRANKYLRFALFAETQLGRLSLERGDLVEAISALKAVVAEATSQNQTLIAVDAAVHLAEAYVRSNDPEAALNVVAEAQQLAGDDAALFEIPLGRVQARALLTLGRREEAAAHIATALAGARQQGLIFEQALLLLIQAELAVSQDPDSVGDALGEAERLLKGLGVQERYLARNPSAMP